MHKRNQINRPKRFVTKRNEEGTAWRIYDKYEEAFVGIDGVIIEDDVRIALLHLCDVLEEIKYSKGHEPIRL